MGSDWIEKPDQKSERSMIEYANLTKYYPNINLVSIPRGSSGRSSTNYKTKGLEKLNNINPYELTILG